MKWKISQNCIYALVVSKNSPNVIWSLKNAVSFPSYVFSFSQKNAFIFNRPKFLNTLDENICYKCHLPNLNIFATQRKIFHFFSLLQIMCYSWNMCPFCYLSEILSETECSLFKFPMLCTKKHSKLITIPKWGSIAVCCEDSIAEKPKNNESWPLCFLDIDDMFQIFIT